jgi:hypothetical protein
MREGAGDERGIALCLAALADRPRYEAAVALARSRLGEAAFAEAWAEGAALSLADAIAYAVDSPPAA